MPIVINPQKPGKEIAQTWECQLCDKPYPLNYRDARGRPGNMRMFRAQGMALLGMVCSACRAECRRIEARFRGR